MTPSRSGQSIFSRPKPIDISAPRRPDIGMDIEDEEDEELERPLVRNSVLFDARAAENRQPRGAFTEMPRAVQAVQDRDTEDVWAELG